MDDRGSAFYVEFKILVPERFVRLESLIGALKTAKDKEYQPDLDGADFRSFLDEGARSWFNASEWSFDSAVSMVGTCEYDLWGIRRMGECTARIEFQPHAAPYGGTASLRVLIDAFGQRITEVKG